MSGPYSNAWGHPGLLHSKMKKNSEFWLEQYLYNCNFGAYLPNSKKTVLVSLMNSVVQVLMSNTEKLSLTKIGEPDVHMMKKGKQKLMKI